MKKYSKWFIIGLFFLVLQSSSVLHTAAATKDTGCNIVFALDISGSMKTTDENRTAIETIKMVIDLCDSTDKVGVVAYNDTIAYCYDLTPLSSSEKRNSLKQNLDLMEYKGETDIGLGLKKAVELLYGEGEQDNSMVILLSDGKTDLEHSNTGRTLEQSQQDLNEAIALAKEKDIKINTIGFANEYNQDRSATITITEHNFDQSKVELIPTNSNVTESGTFPKISGFQSQGDVHKATIEFTEDGSYAFEVAYSDKAGNEGEIATVETFFIDKTEPELSFEGVKEKGAYKEAVSPIIVCKDKNLDASTLKAQVTMVNEKNDTVQVEDALGQLQTSGDTCSIALKNPQTLRENDGIYRITASVMDYAGNEKEETICYSVNRFGSVYTLQKEAKRVAGSYVKNSQAISIVETNADDINGKDVKVKLTKNGEVTELTEGKEYTREQNAEEESWKQYIYTLSEDNFTEDGVYMVSISSKDKAGNHNDNTAEGEAGAQLWFGVDKTSPVIVPLNIQSEESYNLNSLQVEMEVQDNLKLDSVKTYVNNQEVALEQSKDQEHYTFTLQESTQEQTIRMVALDAAGNETVRELKGIYITTNPWVRFIHNRKAVGSVLGVLAVLVAFGIGVVIWRKKDAFKKTGN